ncbi:hypothetical protein Tco_0567425 [Tanacetum coccineum]
MEAIQAFLKEYGHIPPNKKCMALLLAEERFLKIKQTMEEEQNQPEVMQELLLKLMNDLQILKGIQQEKEKTAAQKRFCEIKHALTDKQYRQEDIQELMSKLLEDVRNISEELSEYINCPSWNRPTIFFDDDDEYTIIYSKPKAITPDLPIEEPDNSLSMGDEHLNTILEMESDEEIKYSVEILVQIPSEFEGITDDACDVPDYENPFTFDALNDHYEILSDSNDDSTSSDDDDFEDIEYVSLEEILLNINRLIANIEALKLTPSIPFVLEYPSSSPIPVVDSEFLIEEVDTFLVPEDSIPPSIESDLDSEGDIVFLDNLLNEDPIPEYERFTFDIEPDAPVINNFDELNEDECFDPGGGEIDVSQNIEDDDSFAFVIRTFLPYRTYPVDSPLLLSTGSEDTIFDPGIST